MNRTGILVVLSGPSGVGKASVLRELLSKCPYLSYSISVTTRQPRHMPNGAAEKHGTDYFFVSQPEFDKMIKNGELLEWALFNGNGYGTPRFYVERLLSEGKTVLLEIETKGARQIRKLYPDAVFIFLVPPSFEELKSRLSGRGTESGNEIERRIQIAEQELKTAARYDYQVVNDVVSRAAEQIKEIIDAATRIKSL